MQNTSNYPASCHFTHQGYPTSYYYNDNTTSHQQEECIYQHNPEEAMAGNISNQKLVYLEKNEQLAWQQVSYDANVDWSQQYLNQSCRDETHQEMMEEISDQYMIEETLEDDILLKKNLRERERVGLINDAIRKLQVIVPRDAGTRRKRSKAKLLSSTVDYILQLEKTLHQLRNNKTTGATLGDGSPQMTTQTSQHQVPQFHQNGPERQYQQ